MPAGFPVRRVYFGQWARLYLGVAVSKEEAPNVLQRAPAEVSRRVSGDVWRVLSVKTPVIEKGSGHLCCHRWILLFGVHRA